MDREDDPFHRPWLAVLVGLGIDAYAAYWVLHPTTSGFESGFGLLGRLLKLLFRETGRWPVGIFFAALGTGVLAIGVWGLVRRYTAHRPPR